MSRRIRRAMSAVIVGISIAFGLVMTSCGKSGEERGMTEKTGEAGGVETWKYSGAFEIQYAKWGKGEKTLILLPGIYTKSLMGIAEGAASYYGIFDEEYTTYMFDRVEQPGEDESIEDIARETIEVIEKIGIEKASIVGISMGGMIAQAIGVERPEIVESMVLGSTASKAREKGQKVIGEWVELAEKGDEEALIESFMKAIYSEATIEKYGESIRQSAGGASAAEMRRMATFGRAVMKFDITGRLSKAKWRTLVIGAGEDKIFGREEAEETARLIGGETYIYEDYGHAVYDEAGEYVERAYTFVAGK